jgi:hypothetical protein
LTGDFTYTFDSAAEKATFYTLTSSDTTGTDPASWTLKGSDDGVTWTTIDRRRDQTFDWRLQTRPFKIAKPGAYKHYALTGVTGSSLAEIELLG